MIKLIGQSLSRGAQIDAESIALNLMERQSTAALSLGPEEPEVAVGEWMLDDVEPGAGIVWRVKTVDDTFNTRTRAVTLEHIINTLRDVSMFGEHKTSTIAGDEKAKTVTARQAAEYVLAFQNIWTLGDFEYDMSAPFMFNGDDLFSAMEKISSALDDPWWEYDLTSLPFRLHIRHRSSAKTCEMRMGRNIATLRKTVDRSQMYTRIYPIGKKNLHIEGDFLSKNEGIWGRKDKVETDQSQETEEALRLWAQDRLNRHCEPLVTITIGGLELSRATGESLDHLTLGTMCQVPLPEFHTTITERITKLSWKDKVKEPESVTVTLCNIRQDLASIISQQAAGGGGGARAAAKEAEEDHAWFVDTDSHVAMVAEAIIGRSEDGVDWSRVAEIIVDGEGIHDYVVAAQGSLVVAFGRMDMTDESMTTIYQKTGVDGLAEGETLFSKITQTAESISAEVRRATAAEEELSSRITMTAESITAEVTRATEAEGTLSSRITQTAESITAEVTRATEAEGNLSGRITATAESLTTVYSKTGINSLGQNETLYSKISQNATAITTKVSAGDIASTINQTAQSVLISASKINLEGYVTATELDAEKARLDNLTSGTTTASTIRTSNLYVTYLTVGSQMGVWAIPSIGTKSANAYVLTTDASLNLNHSHDITITESGGSMVVTIKSAQAAEGSANFSIAATQTYIDGVAAAKSSVALSGAWSGSVFTVTATNGKTIDETFTAGKGTGNQQIGGQYTINSFDSSHKAYGYVNATRVASSRLFTFNVDATSEYNAGVTAGKNSVNVTKTWEDNVCSCFPSAGTGTGQTITITQTTQDPTTAAPNLYRVTIKDGSTSVLYFTVDASARYTAGYNAGYTAGAASVSQRSAIYGSARVETVGEGGNNSTGVFTVFYDDETFERVTSHAINASAAYNAGYEAGAAASTVTLNAPTWSGGYSDYSNTYTVSASNGASKSQTVYLTESQWASGKCTVYLRTGSLGGARRASIGVNIPDPTNWSIQYNASGETVSFTVGGKSFTHTFS